MQQLIAPEKEPITPLVQKVRSIYDDHGISTVLVLGGSGDYFGPADLVLAMDHYLPQDLTAAAGALAGDIPTSAFSLPSPALRIPDPSSVDPHKAAAPYRGNRRGGGRDARPPRENIKAHGTRGLSFGREEIDLSLLAQLVDDSQVRAIGRALAHARHHFLDGQTPLREALEKVMQLIEEEGLQSLDPRNRSDLAGFRLQELAAALNRLRSLRMIQGDSR
jgi:predicted ABC-class ATPase